MMTNARPRLALLLALLALSIALPLHAQDDEDAIGPTTYTTTMMRQDGNRAIAGQGRFPDVTAADVPLETAPTWLVGASIVSDPVWVVADENGGLRGVYPLEGVYQLSPSLGDGLPAGMPPLLITDGFGSYIDRELPSDIAPLTSPARALDRLVYVANDGALVLQDTADGALLARISAGAAADMRVVVNNLGQAALYADATDQRYVHGIMGDRLEGAALLVVDLGFGAVTARVELPGLSVFEGLSPMWADVDRDGLPDLVATRSDGDEGAQIVVYNADGLLIAEGPTIGRGGRWRHQLAWAPFGPEGEYLLAEVLTPHIGGIVGFFRYDRLSGELVRVGRLDGYTSHVINSRNLDMAVAGDFDGDGQAELVLPDQALRRIAGLALEADGTVSERWSLPLDGQLVTNLSAVALPDGTLALAAGVAADEGGYRMRVWR